MEDVTAYWLPVPDFFCALIEWPCSFLNLVLGVLPQVRRSGNGYGNQFSKGPGSKQHSVILDCKLVYEPLGSAVSTYCMNPLKGACHAATVLNMFGNDCVLFTFSHRLIPLLTCQFDVQLDRIQCLAMRHSHIARHRIDARLCICRDPRTTGNRQRLDPGFKSARK